MKNNQNNSLNDLIKSISSADKEGKENIAKQLLRKLNSEEANTLNEVMNDNNKLQQIMNSDTFRLLAEKLNKHNNG